MLASAAHILKLGKKILVTTSSIVYCPESHKGISYYDFDLLIKFTIIKMGSQLLTFCQMTRLKKFKQTDHLTSLRKF